MTKYSIGTVDELIYESAIKGLNIDRNAEVFIKPTVKESLTVQPLSNEEIDKLTMTSLVGSFNCRIFARAIEKHHGIGE